MLIASYRNTERGICAARQKPVVLPFVMPVKPQLVVPDKCLVSVTLRKFDKFLDDLSVEMAAYRLGVKHRHYRTHFDRIVQRLCRVFQVSVIDLHSDRRDRAAASARQAIYYWTWRLTRLSAPQIGRRLGNRDHTTVLYGVTAYQRKRAQMGRHLRELRKGRK